MKKNIVSLKIEKYKSSVKDTFLIAWHPNDHLLEYSDLI